MKKLILALTLILCLTVSVFAGDIDGTGKTPPPCTQNCAATTQQEPVEDSAGDTFIITVIELLTTLLAAR